MEKTISDKICEFRKARSLTQEQLGEKLGISGQAVSKWEKGDSMPDIMLLPELCDILGISIDALLEVPVSLKNKNIMQDFCAYAREQGRSATIINALSRLFGDVGISSEENWIDFGPEYIRIYDNQGMGFAVDGSDYLKKCLDSDLEDTTYIMRILANESLLSVLRLFSIDKAITKKEISEATGLDEEAVNQILVGFFKRGMVVCEKDKDGKRGYLQGDAMAGIYMILAGCQVLSENGAINGYKRFTRTKQEHR